MRVLNFRSDNDSVLKIILKQSKPNTVPVGLNELETNVKNHYITNIDATEKINGHSAYNRDVHVLGEYLKLNEE